MFGRPERHGKFPIEIVSIRASPPTSPSCRSCCVPNDKYPIPQREALYPKGTPQPGRSLLATADEVIE